MADEPTLGLPSAEGGSKKQLLIYGGIGAAAIGLVVLLSRMGGGSGAAKQVDTLSPSENIALSSLNDRLLQFQGDTSKSLQGISSGFAGLNTGLHELGSDLAGIRSGQSALGELTTATAKTLAEQTRVSSMGAIEGARYRKNGKARKEGLAAGTAQIGTAYANSIRDLDAARHKYDAGTGERFPN